MRAFTTAVYYDVFAGAAGRLAREGPLLTELLRRAPGERVLDLACGTGLHAGYLAELGAQVTALDVSADMVAYAREHRSHPAVDYVVGDMREFRGGPWDLVVCLGNSLCLVNSFEELQSTLHRVALSLAPDGLFLLQILNYASGKAREPRQRVETRTVGDKEVIAVKDLVPHANRTLLSMTFHVLSAEGHEAICETAVLLNVTRAQLTAAAEKAGLVVEAVCGGFDGCEYRPDSSPDLVVALQKPE